MVPDAPVGMMPDAPVGAMPAAAPPERLDRFMARAVATYYARQDPFGAGGDFTTAPEMTQAFGECLGLWAAITWEAMGKPDPVLLVELGPGRGTLMADALRAAAEMVPAFRAALRVHLVETSPRLREVQASRLTPAVAAWHDDIAALPPGPAIVIGNEFLDALPIRQFLLSPEGWRERLVGVVEGRLGFGLSAPLRQVPDTPAFRAARPGDLVEHCAAAQAAVAASLRPILAHGGLALFIDYGGWRSRGDTLQALRAHRFDDVLAHPGEADLTAHVDFEPLAALAPAHAYAPQGEVLRRLGIETRAAQLAPHLTGALLENHWAALARLTHPEEMGSLFKVLALTRAGAPLPPGFAP